MERIRKYLFVSAVFIIVVGLFYGAPKEVIEGSFGVSIDDNALHIFRAIMGLYCGVGFMVLLGAKYKEYTKFSLLLEAIFFGGIGVGRLISLVIDGNVHTVSVVATAFELMLFIFCIVVLRTYNKVSIAEAGEKH